MSFISKFGCLTANLLSRRTVLSASAIQKAGLFSNSQTLIADLNVTTFQKRHIFSKSVLLERFKQQDAKNSRPTFDADSEEPPQISEEQMKEEMASLLNEEKWSLIYGWPQGVMFWLLVKKLKLVYKFATFVHVPWATYAFYASSFQHVNIIAASYSAAIIPPLLLYLFTRKLKNTIGTMSMHENNRFIRVSFFANFAAERGAIFRIKDILLVPDIAEHPGGQKLKKFHFHGYTFYFPIKNVAILDRERAKLVFENLDDFTEDSKMTEMIKKQYK